jgi:hypothetical protein
MLKHRQLIKYVFVCLKGEALSKINYRLEENRSPLCLEKIFHLNIIPLLDFPRKILTLHVTSNYYM